MEEFIRGQVNRLKKKYRTNEPFALLEALGVNVRYNYGFQHLKAFYYIMLGVPYVVINGDLEEPQRKPSRRMSWGIIFCTGILQRPRRSGKSVFTTRHPGRNMKQIFLQASC